MAVRIIRRNWFRAPDRPPITFKNKNTMETWKNIHNGKYSISDNGNVKNNKTGKILKQTPSTRGYARVSLPNKDKKTPTILFPHREVAELFIDNPDNKPQVNHKDGDKLNPRKDNLEWVTNKENSEHAIRTGLVDSKKQSRIATMASVKVLSVETTLYTDNFCKTYSSMAEAAKSINATPGNIWAAKKRNGTVKGYKVK